MPVDAPLYPVNLVVRDQPVLVVGGGRVAAGKVRGLVAGEARVTVVAPEVDDGIVRHAGVTVVRRPYRAGDLDGQRLVITATGDAAVDAAVSADAQAAGIWVNSADDPDHCTFTLPAVARRGHITVAVSTAGHSPALASWMRRRLEAELGPEYDILLEMLAGARTAVKESGRTTESLDWHSALESGMLDLIRAGQVQEARERLEACLSSS